MDNTQKIERRLAAAEAAAKIIAVGIAAQVPATQTAFRITARAAGAQAGAKIAAGIAAEAAAAALANDQNQPDINADYDQDNNFLHLESPSPNRKNRSPVPSMGSEIGRAERGDSPDLENDFPFPKPTIPISVTTLRIRYWPGRRHLASSRQWFL